LFETSAEDGFNVNEAFEWAARSALKYLLNHGNQQQPKNKK